MNKVIMMGRLTKDPELRQTQTGLPVCTIRIAVDRRFKSQDGERKTDFFDVVAWRQTAEFIHRYFTKGRQIAVVGTLQTRSWEDQQGQKRYATEVVADEVYFADSKRSESDSDRDAPPERTFNAPKDDGDFLPKADDQVSLPFDID